MSSRFFPFGCLTLLGFLATSQLQAQSKTELQAQVARLQTDLAESRKFVNDLADRLVVLESQQESLLRLRRELETITAERDGLGKRLTALEAEAATLRQAQGALQERQQTLATGPQFYNAMPPAGGNSVQVNDSMGYLTASDSTALKPSPKRTYRAKPTRKKAVKTSARKRRRR